MTDTYIPASFFKNKNLLGKGEFSLVYDGAKTGLDGLENKVIIVTRCPAKISHAELGSNNKYLPSLERIDWTQYSYNLPWNVSKKMPDNHMVILGEKLTPLSKLHVNCSPKQKAGARVARDFIKYFRSLKTNDPKLFELMLDERPEDIPGEFLPIVEALVDAWGTMCNYVDGWTIKMECSPRNVAIRDNGEFVLNDCLFSRDY